MRRTAAWRGTAVAGVALLLSAITGVGPSSATVNPPPPTVGIAPAREGEGYYLVASDGGVFAYGGARFSGSTGSINLVQPIVGMAADPDAVGYLLAAADGGVFAFDADFYGSAAGKLAPGDRVTGITVNSDGGYILGTAKGQTFSYGPPAGTVVS